MAGLKPRVAVLASSLVFTLVAVGSAAPGDGSSGESSDEASSTDAPASAPPTSAPPASAPPPAAANARQDSPPSVESSETELSGAAAVQLTNAEMIERASKTLEQMGLQAEQISKMVDDAKADSDPAKLVCIVDKDGQMTAALEAAGVRFDNLKQHSAAGDSTRAKHEFDIITVFGEQSLALVSEANQCVGQETGFSGDAVVDFQVDQGLPTVDSDFINDVFVTVVPPSVQSTVTGDDQ